MGAAGYSSVSAGSPKPHNIRRVRRTMENLNSLVPCPFCGGKGKLIVLAPRMYGMPGAFILCQHCKAQGPIGSTWETHYTDKRWDTSITPQSIEKGKLDAVRGWNAYTALKTAQ